MEDIENIFAEADDTSAMQAEETAQETDAQEQTADVPGEAEADAGDAAQTSDQTQAAQTQAAQTQTESEMFPLKFYGQDVLKSREETLTLAQKGMNYDKVYERMQAAEPAAKLIEDLAAQSGMSVQEYVKYAEGMVREQQLNQLSEREVPREVAEELIQLRQQHAQYMQQQAAAKAQETEQKAKEERARQFAALIEEYPDIAKNQQLPQEVVMRISKGETPLSAYRAYENAQLKAAIAAREAENKNKQTAPGSVAGVGEKQIADEFEKGFNSGFGY